MKERGRVKITSFKSSLEYLTKGTTIPLVYCSSGHREQRKKEKRNQEKNHSSHQNTSYILTLSAQNNISSTVLRPSVTPAMILSFCDM